MLISLHWNITKQFTDSLATALSSNKNFIEPLVFDRNTLELFDWEINLETYLRGQQLSDKEKLRHLKQYVSGNARKFIECHFTTNTNNDYFKARLVLKETTNRAKQPQQKPTGLHSHNRNQQGYKATA